MKVSNKPLNLIIRKEFAEQIIDGSKKYELRELGSNLGHKMFDGVANFANAIKYETIRFQLGYTKKYILVENKSTLILNFNEMMRLPESALTSDDAYNNPDNYKEERRLSESLGFSDDYLSTVSESDKDDLFFVVFSLGEVKEVCID